MARRWRCLIAKKASVRPHHPNRRRACLLAGVAFPGLDKEEVFLVSIFLLLKASEGLAPFVRPIVFARLFQPTSWPASLDMGGSEGARHVRGLVSRGSGLH